MTIEVRLRMAAVGDAMDEVEEITVVAEEDTREEEEEGDHPLVSTMTTPIVVVVVMEIVTEMTSSLNVDEVEEGVGAAEEVITMTMKTIDLQDHPRGEDLEWDVEEEDHLADVAVVGVVDSRMEEAVVMTIVVIMEILVVAEEDGNL